MPHAYAARERCNNACMMVFSLRFSTKYRVFVQYQTLCYCCYSLTHRVLYSGDIDKKLSYCWETVRRESMPRIAEMDVEMTT